VLPFLDPTLPAREIDWADDRPILQIFLGGLNSVSCTRFRDRRPQDQIFRNIAIKNGRSHGGHEECARSKGSKDNQVFCLLLPIITMVHMMILGDNRNPNRYSHTMNISNFAPQDTPHTVLFSLISLSSLISRRCLHGDTSYSSRTSTLQ
jgi:hypothetical protein